MTHEQIQLKIDKIVSEKYNDWRDPVLFQIGANYVIDHPEEFGLANEEHLIASLEHIKLIREVANRDSWNML